MHGIGAPLRGLHLLVDRTPPARERFIDLLRAVAIVSVVLGHWLATVIGHDAQGRLTGRSALPDLPWAHPLTWVVQVLPLFFLVGGYANAVSLESRRRRGGDTTGWLLDRGGRLVPPTTALVLVMAGAALAARLFPVDPGWVRTVVWFASIPLWFLSVYLIVVVLTPPMHALHRRYGLAVPVVLTGLVAAGDVARLNGAESLGNGSFVFGWLAVHQMGFAWRDGLLPARPRVALPLLLGGLGALLLLTLAGPYPISMINVPGERLHNMSPPSLALLAVATVQIGLALLVKDRAERWLRRRGPWTVVVAVNAVVLTIFLWHVTAAILLTGLLDLLGVLPVQRVGSASWLAWRIPWLVMLVPALAVLVAIFGPVEIRAARRRPVPAVPRSGALGWARPAATVAGLAAVALGLLLNSLFPNTEPALFGLPAVALAAFLGGAATLRLLRSPPRAEPGGGRVTDG
ncbi:hypothetical protein Misp01_47940 [Microtetraspora sp. NBRC 13810]|uniref:acyltransferase family protein n=1 Tax=Microtetraspora sp. NBRC 13810 TaxID=3030990 RepID=UPI0024A4A2AC|nr:acyltransferase [Microtetraspora sp. NBRC 13810]GLW09665.1 hypothetical protein Misp01_47940 [Microtetraspora sp. NBRC 13810]